MEEGALNRPACPTPGHGGASSSHGGGRKGFSALWGPLGQWGLWPQGRLRNNLPPGMAGQGRGPAVGAGLTRQARVQLQQLLSVFRAAGSAHLSSHHQASKEDSRERILGLLHWRRQETEPRDCVQALPGMTWEAAEGAGASGGPRTTAGHAASSSTLKYPPKESLGPSPVMLDYEERRVRASERRREGLLGT